MFFKLNLTLKLFRGNKSGIIFKNMFFIFFILDRLSKKTPLQSSLNIIFSLLFTAFW